MIGEIITPFEDIEIKFIKGEKIHFFLNKKILYFKSELLHNVNQYYLITQSLLKINKDMNVNDTKFNLLVPLTDDFKKIYRLKAIQNLFILYQTTSENIICLYLKNSEYNKKRNDFCLFLNFNTLFYHSNLEDGKKMKNEIYKDISYLEKDDKCNEKYYSDLKMIDLLFDRISDNDYSKVNIDRKFEHIRYFELYQIKIN